MGRPLKNIRWTAALAVQAGSRLLLDIKSQSNDEHDLSSSQRVAFLVISVGLVMMAGLMSGLTLGLMSMDLVELEVLKRSGTATEQMYAAVIMPIVSNQVSRMLLQRSRWHLLFLWSWDYDAFVPDSLSAVILLQTRAAAVIIEQPTVGCLQHFLLVTLLLCNAVAMEALPLFLDRLADPVTAILISVTAVLVFGEILPQAVCSRYVSVIGTG